MFLGFIVFFVANFYGIRDLARSSTSIGSLSIDHEFNVERFNHFECKWKTFSNVLQYLFVKFSLGT
ncbi:hypothetical protein OIU79_015010, partial [Salix purpurea]